MKALIGAKTIIGNYLSQKTEYDYVIDPSNIDLLRGKTFDRIDCIPDDRPEEKTEFAQEKDTLRLQKLQDILTETKATQFTLILPASLYAPSQTTLTENSPLLSSETTQDSYLLARSEFSTFVNSRFGRVLNLFIPTFLGCEGATTPELKEISTAAKAKKIPSNKPYQIYDITALPQDMAKAWALGLQKLNLAPSPVTAIEIIREINPKLIEALAPMEENATSFPSVLSSLYAIYWLDPACGFLTEKLHTINLLK